MNVNCAAHAISSAQLKHGRLVCLNDMGLLTSGSDGLAQL